MISAAQMHPQLTFLCRRDGFFCADSSLSCSFSPQRLFGRSASSLSCSFSPQGLLLPPGFIPILLFCAAGMISAAQMHPQLAFLCRRDDFFCADSSLSCSFSPQRLFRPLGFILILLFFTAGIIATARIHLYLTPPCCRDYFFCADASLSCSFPPQGLLRPPGFISILFFCAAGIISAAQIHPRLALFFRR